MGCFSFIKMDTRTNILMGTVATLLFPHGGKLTDFYDGYGRLGEYDVHALSAIWNRQVVLDNVDKVIKDSWFTKYVNPNSDAMKFYLDRNNTDNDVMSRIDDLEEDIRIIGIHLFFKAKELLKYPLKFVDDASLSYDDVEASLDDPEQGWVHYCLDDETEEEKNYLNPDIEVVEDLEDEEDTPEGRLQHLYELYQMEPNDLTEAELKELKDAGYIDDVYEDDEPDDVCSRCGCDVWTYDGFFNKDTGEPLCPHCYDELYK